MSPSKSPDPVLHLELGDFYISKEEGKSLDDFRKEADENLANVQRGFEQMFKDFKADTKARIEGQKYRDDIDQFLKHSQKSYVPPNDEMMASYQVGGSTSLDFSPGDKLFPQAVGFVADQSARGTL